MIVRTVAQLREQLSARRAGSIGFVPTMGALHEGHLSLLRAARAENDTVVLSIFVNPTQFNDPKDLEAYPRTEDSDVVLAETAGADIIFAPAAIEMYPHGAATTVSVTGPIAETLEGAHRGRGHFDGVATVVTKLLLAVLPDVAYFGAKDAQQVVVVRRAVADLNIPVRVATCPTTRDHDGLALSSRNTRLSPAERAQALAIPRALGAMRDAAATTVAHDLIALGTAILADDGLVPEYLAVVDPDTLEDVTDAGVRPALAVVAVMVGATRLIDNVLLTPEDS